MLSNFFQLSPLPANQIFGHYDFKLVTLSFLMAILTSYIAIDIIGNIHYQKYWRKFLWLAGAAFTMGGGMWSMHFVGMLSFHLPHSEMSYDLYWTLLSLVIVVVSSALSIALLLNKVIKTYHILFGGIFLGCASAAMHYTGMEAMRYHINFLYDPLLFIDSLLISITASLATIWIIVKSNAISFNLQSKLKLLSAFIMGGGMCAMHYIGMAAAVFTPKSHSLTVNHLDPTLLSITIAAVTCAILISAYLFTHSQTALQKLHIRLEREKRSIEESLGAKLQFALDTAQFGSWDLNLVTNTVRRTQMHDQIYGNSNLSPEWTTEMFYQQVHPDDRDRIMQVTKAAIKNNTVLSHKFRIYRANDDSLRWLWARGRCANINGVPHLVGLTQDITDAMLASEKLRISEERLRLLLNSIKEYAIYMITAEGNVSYWNLAAEKIFGYSEDEIKGRNTSIFFSKELQEKHHPEMIRRIAREEDCYEEKEWRVRKNGTKFFADSITTPLYSNNNLIGYCIISRDLTEQLLTESKLRMISELRRSNLDLEQFAYVASHDLRAPLRAIKNLSTWIEEEKENILTPGSTENLQLLMERTTRMEKLIEGILKYSRAGLVDKATINVDLGILIKEIIMELNPPKSFTISYPKNLPTLHTSRVQLHQVLCNLIDNAIKYHDRIDGHIEIGLKDLGDFYDISVKDDGPGIDEQYHAKIFELFQTLQSQDLISGAGLGLSIVKKIVEAQGGKVTVESSIGKGANFRFTWPKLPLPSNVDYNKQLERMV